MLIGWSEKLKTDISIIDEQHKMLFETLERLDNLKGTKAGFKQLLIELQIYISNHFKTEEEYMKYTDYPDAAAHKAHHCEFLESYKSIIKKNSSSDSVYQMESEMVSFVENWMQTHYSTADIHLANHIKHCQSCGNSPD